MILLISVIIILLLAVTLLLFYPWKGEQTANRDRLNQAFYQARLRELEEDNPPDSPAVRAQMQTDLQQNLLDDIPEVNAEACNREPGRWILIPGVVALIALSIGVYYKTGSSAQVVAWQQVADETPELLQRVMNPQAKPLNAEDLARLGLGLRTRLQSDPDNREGWSVLGRIGVVLNNATLSTQAFEKAYKLAPENPDVKLDYADVLARGGDEESREQAGRMLRALLKHSPDNLRALSLLAFNAFQQQQYPQAIEAWESMLRLSPQDDPRREAIAKSIEKARVESGADKAQMKVTITLSPEAQKAQAEGGVIVISVTDGQSPVPVAAKKIPQGHFPLTVVLNDDDAMMPERLLSGLHSGVVSVHLSASGNIKRQKGDWYGQTTVNNINATAPVAVTVAQLQQ